MIIRILLTSLAALWLLALPARADTDAVLKNAALQYRQGRVLDAEAALTAALSSAANPGERWALANFLTDICAYSFDYACIVASQKSLSDAASVLNAPQVTAAKLVFVIAFQKYLEGDLEFFRKNGGLEFSLKIANPLADPAMATRLFLLNAALEQKAGDFSAAHRMIDRAFASFLRIDSGKDAFETAGLLKELISLALANHDAARALNWALIGEPIIRAGLSPASFDYADYLTITAQIAEILTITGDPARDALDKAMDATARLQIAPGLKDGLVSALAINQAALYGLRGDKAAMQAHLGASPYAARRAAIIARGGFSDFDELYYAAAEIFFDALGAKTPDPAWRPLFEKNPSWTLGTDLAAQQRIYTKVALALLNTKAAPEAARGMLKDAARESLAQFERGRGDIRAFALPTLLDRLSLAIAIGTMPPEPKAADADLLLSSLELLGRNPRYTVSDTLTVLAAQQTDTQRHAAHALLRLADRQKDWEARQLKALAARMAARQPFPAQDFTPQFTAQSFADSLARMTRGVNAPPTRLPSAGELQAALAADEAFIGIVQGVRVCVRRDGLWIQRMAVDSGQLILDVKLLSASLSAQNAPSAKLDAQYPAAAAMRLYHLLFDGLEPCLNGARHLIYFPPGEVAAIPLAALLREEPPKSEDGYDLSRAHWLILDYAVSTVTSVRDFLSARSLSRALARRPGGGLAFAGIGDPKLRGPAAGPMRDMPELPETGEEVTAIAKLFPAGTDLKLGDAASEENVRSLPLDQFQILHFATHGLLRDDIDGLSEAALVFTPEDTANPFDDGLLTASEVANLNLAARLVVLSACNTANFDPTIFTSQLQGLSSAFAAAGAPTTVASLWSVNSQTGMRLMVRFYQKLVAPDAPGVASALQQAMIETLREAPSPAFANPRFWAPFIVLGDGGIRIAKSLPPPSRDSRVEVSRGGGEIMAMADNGGVLVSSEIGPMENGRASSLIRGRDAGAVAWTIEDKQIGAGALAMGSDRNFAAGYVWREKSVPVLRAISKEGKLLWRTEIASRFDSAVIASLATAQESVFAVIAPLTSDPGKIEFDLVRLDFAGREMARRSVTMTRPDARASTDRTIFASAVLGDSLYLTASYPPIIPGAIRNDFGFISVCHGGRGARAYKIKTGDLSVQQEADLTGLRIHGLQTDQGALIFAGSVPEGCAWNSEQALFGRLGTDLKPQTLWKDDGAFYGHLVSVTPEPGGYAAIADIAEPLDISQPSPVNPAAKYPDGSGASLSETVLIRFDKRGGVREKLFLGNGLPQYSQGLIRTGAGGITVFGSDGFNPWFERIN
ncbi:MAG: CHAT domain-containing protein [Alphaproteobacteria bacterium]|nr:CHAT domain-containing protein [Alphaproteobacteria bacterium]